MNTSVEFAKHYPELANPSQAPGKAAAGSEAMKRHRAVMEAHRKAQKQGWDIVTVVNLHAFQLDLNMGALGHLTIPAKKQGETFSLKVIDTYRLDMRDMGDANFNPEPVFPKEMAEDITRYYAETGGVFFYEGEGRPPQDQLEESMKAQINWYWGLFQEGNSNWSQYQKNPRHISERMRDAAKALFAMKLINEQPEWVVISRSESPDTPCEGCGNVIAKVAKFCPACHTIYDVAWVKARRPDLWRAQNPPEAQMAGVKGGGPGSGASVDIAGLIKQEQAPQPEAKPGPAPRK